MTEPDAREVEALASGWLRRWLEDGKTWRLFLCDIASEVLQRESALVAALERISNGTTFNNAMVAFNALTRYRAAQQPEPPTIIEVLETVERRLSEYDNNQPNVLAMVRAALARERGQVTK